MGEAQPEEERLITEDELAAHNVPGDCWIAINGMVCDVTSFLDDHPGGGDIIAAIAGKDATDDFEDCHHSDAAREMMKTFSIGRLLKAEGGQPKQGRQLSPRCPFATVGRPPPARGYSMWALAAVGACIAAVALVAFRRR